MQIHPILRASVTLLRKPHPTVAVHNVENPGAATVYDLTTANRSDNSTEAHVQTLNQTLTRPGMEPSDCEMPGRTITHSSTRPPDSLFEACSWFYALCREYLFRDHTQEIARALFPPNGPAPGTHVLELGCGPGFYACRLSQEYPQIHTTGVDLSRRLIARAQSRAASRSLQNCTFAHGDAHALPDPDNSIDAVVVSRLFLIVANREAVLNEIFRVLRPGGRCFIAEPTSGFRTRIPLGCMWLLSKLSSTPAGKYREPSQADVMTAPDFSALIHSQPWGVVDLQYDGWYQYAVCEKASATLGSSAYEEQPADWSAA
jgi:ubiquinone/menaquinone biosynthesis C-methylase UbiE